MRPIFPERSLLVGALLLSVFLEAGCSENMAVQPSFQPQEGPRKHSPPGSIPQESRSISISPPPRTPKTLRIGAELFEVNCSHCHGKEGEGNGPVARHLIVPPENLRSAQIQSKPLAEIYDIVTNGREMMPAFERTASTEERWAVAYFVKSFGRDGELPLSAATAQKKAARMPGGGMEGRPLGPR